MRMISLTLSKTIGSSQVLLTSCCLSLYPSSNANDPSNPFIANYQIYRLPLKTIKILSWHLRLVLNWTLESPSLPFHAHRHLCKSIWNKDEKTIFGPKDCLSAINGSSFDGKLLLFAVLNEKDREREWDIERVKDSGRTSGNVLPHEIKLFVLWRIDSIFLHWNGVCC